ncbi:MAG: glycosyltransferase family 2 protein [Thermodesulfobacteriota bacterium]
MKKKYKISLVIPCLNEEGNILSLYEGVKASLKGHSSYEIIFIDDGSRDATLANIVKLAATDKKVKYISFSRNFGHQMALKAGLEYSTGDVVISMDADLQHPPELIPEMIEKWKEGYDIVYTIRDDTGGEGGGGGGSMLKNATGRVFYSVINWLADFNMERGVADFRLIDRAVVDELRKFNESSLFYRGLVSWVGYRQTGISYCPGRRLSGATKYTFGAMFKLAAAGITSFSVKPLHVATIAGFLLSALSIVYAFYALAVYFFTDTAVSGWTSVLASILFIGGFQLIMLGILGEYIGKIFIETRRRPGFLVKGTNIKVEPESSSPRRERPPARPQ